MTLKIGFLIFPGFPMACLTSMIEPLRAANEIAGQEAFGWKLVSEHGGRVMSSAKVAFEADVALALDLALDLLFVLSGPAARFADARSGNGALRSLGRHGVTLGGVSGGVFPLVRSGVMEGRPVSVHWCYEAAFKAEFPDVRAMSEVIVSSPGRHTVSGAASAFDLALGLIEDRLSPDVAHEVACWFQHPMMRGEGVRQRVPKARMPDTGAQLPALVARCVEIFAAHLDTPVSVADVARRTGVSPRQVERAFKKATGQSPSHYYRALRMQAARQLVMHSSTRVADIAAAVGYGSVIPLATHYRAAFGCSPREDRDRINQFRVAGDVPLPVG
ncbi:MAG: transcriptional regulator GlxA family with amidase domain [Paracoccaceae bacterium]|jgi:transcriptional regulator GlxA family with amidase domain